MFAQTLLRLRSRLKLPAYAKSGKLLQQRQIRPNGALRGFVGWRRGRSDRHRDQGQPAWPNKKSGRRKSSRDTRLAASSWAENLSRHWSGSRLWPQIAPQLALAFAGK